MIRTRSLRAASDQPLTFWTVSLNASAALAPATLDRTAAQSYPAAVKPAATTYAERRTALGLSADDLASILGITPSDVAVIETASLGAEVEFLHNLALSVLELEAIHD